MPLTDINGCLCSHCKKWHSHIYKDIHGRSICIECKNKEIVKRRTIKK